MSKLLRYFEPGQYCFVTSITASRQPLLEQNSQFLARAVHRAHQRSRFSVVAWAVLPDHVHALLHTPNGDTSKIVQRVKLSFSLMIRSATQTNGPYWQHRYWDHVIRDQDDMNRHIDYIHYNPVKHGLVTTPEAWPLTSFRRHRRAGIYGPDWCVESKYVSKIDYGE